MSEPKIFISYSRQDVDFAQQIANSLADLGADVWIDIEDIEAGVKWSTAIQQGLDSTDLLIVIISPDSMRSRNVEDEWQYYLDNGKPIVPVLLRQAKIHFQLSRIQYVDFLNNDYDIALKQLTDELERKGVHLSRVNLRGQIHKMRDEGDTVIPPGHTMQTRRQDVPEEDLTMIKSTFAVDAQVKEETATRWIVGGAIAVMALIIIILLFLLLNANGSDNQQVADQPTEVIEVTEASEPTVTVTDIPEVTANDTDNDGLTDEEELELGTDPEKADTDTDTLPDGDEINIYGTNPLERDSDFDMWTDFEEIVVHETNPMSNDTDGDGRLDSVDPDPLNAPTPKPDEPIPGFNGAYISNNDDWQPVIGIRGDNDTEIALVPAGCYTMGLPQADEQSLFAICEEHLDGDTCEELFVDQRNTQEICFDNPFWIDKYEVSNLRFGSAAGTYNHDDVPRTNLNWDEAQQFCETQGGRLPTEAEWEYAARGPDGLLFPWGNEFTSAEQVNYCDVNCESDSWKDNVHDDGHAASAFVYSFPQGASWVGAEQMAGNVWEWTSTIYFEDRSYDADTMENLNDTETKRTVRGGSWNWILGEATSVSRADHFSGGPLTDFYGFRCAYDYQDGDLEQYADN